MRMLMQFAVATLVTVVLFWFMHLLIAAGDVPGAKPNPPTPITIVRVQLPAEPPPVQPPPQPPTTRVRPPEPPIDPVTPRGPTTRVGINVPPTGTEGTGPGLGALSGDPMPVATVPPQYPRDALLNGVEGHVRLEFTIGADGRVSDVRVLESTPRGVFDAAARQAISRWQFRPRMRDGVPVASRAGYTISFSVSDH